MGKGRDKMSEKGTCHYGVWIQKDVPITGVVNNTSPEFLVEECIYDSVDLTCLDCRETNADDIDFDADDICDGCDSSGHSLLIGDWKQNDKGLYEPDRDGPNGYSAISREVYAQVVWSKHTARCALCSPCYPGQASLGTPGEWLTYDLPPNIWG